MSSITSRQLERKRAVTTKAMGGRLISRRHRKALERVVLSYLITFTAQKLSDDVFFENLFDKVYLKLPTGVKTILSRECCLQYIIMIKALLLEKLYAHPDSRSSPAKK